MKITNVRINGIENPVGFAYDYLLCSWNVEEAKGKKQINAIIEVSDSEDFSDILYKKEAADLKQNGEKLEVELKPRTTYYYRVTVFTEENAQQVKLLCLRQERWRNRGLENGFHQRKKIPFILY